MFPVEAFKQKRSKENTRKTFAAILSKNFDNNY